MRVKYTYGAGLSGSDVEDEFYVDESEIEGMTEDEKEKYISELVWEAVVQNINWGYEIVEEAKQC